MKKQQLVILLTLCLTCQPLFAAGQGMGHDSSGGYTDEEFEITQEYYHDGLIEDATQDGIDELTKQYMNQGMSEEEATAKANSIVGGTTEDYEPIENVPLELVSQMYSVVLGAMPSTFATQVSFTDKEITDAYNAKQDKLVDKALTDSEGGKFELNQTGLSQDEVFVDGKVDTEAIKNAGASEDQLGLADDYNKLEDQKQDALDKSAEEGDTEKDNQDYCKYVAMAGETLAAFQAQMSEENITATAAASESGNEQIDALYAAKRAHMDESENCEMKRNIWGATAGCYVLLMFTSGAATTFNPASAMPTNGKALAQLGLKLTASGLLTKWYDDAAKAHKGNAKKIQTIIDQMPEKGDCNPVNQRNCYCSQESTQNDTTYCSPQLSSRTASTSSIQTACLDNKMEADPKCACKATNTCYETTYMNMAINSGYATAFTEKSLDTIKDLSDGSITSGNYSGSTAGYNAAQKNLIKRLQNGISYNGNLTSQQKKGSDALTAYGVPAKLSKVLSAVPSSKSAKKYTGRVARSFNRKNASKYRARSSKNKDGKVLYFGGNKKGRRASTSSKKSARGKLAYRAGAKTSASQVLNFAEKAARNSQINKSSDKVIFDIISRRYQVSGWRELDFEK